MKRTKRGGMTLTTLVELTIVVLLAFAFFSATGLLTNKEEIKSLYVARDVAYLIDAQQATTFNAEFTYPHSFQNRNLIINKTQIQVIQNDDGAKNRIAFTQAFFTPTTFITTPPFVSVPANFFTISKIESTISVFAGRMSEVQRRVLDDDTRVKNTISKKDIVVNTVGLPSKDHTLLSVELANILGEEARALEFRTGESSNVELQIGFFDNPQNIVYYSSTKQTQTKPLAQELINSLSQRFTFKEFPLQKDGAYDQATIILQFSNKTQVTDVFNEKESKDEGTKRIVAKIIAQTLNDFYN